MTGLYNIPARHNFSESLAAGILARFHEDVRSDILIFLPTRRACRALQDAFVQINAGKPILLPRLSPIGDIDEDIFFLGDVSDDIRQEALNIKPAISSEKKRLLLTRLIMGLPDYKENFEQAFALAETLGRLVDQVIIEELDWTNLENIVPEELSEHWQHTTTFLKILTETWPSILESQGLIEPARRRKELMDLYTKFISAKDIDTPLIAAGSTGSIPSTARFLKAVLNANNGHVILPGLDQEIKENDRDLITPTHPQYTLQKLLTFFGKTSEGANPWNVAEGNKLSAVSKAREWLAHQAMMPSESCRDWQDLKLSEKNRAEFENAMKGLSLCEAENEQEEALSIAICMRGVLEEKGKTAALLTPDRKLAKRVQTICKRWGIELDDSAGQPLSRTLNGAYFMACLDVTDPKDSAIHLLSLLKNPLCDSDASYLEKLETRILRGPVLKGGFDSLIKKAQQKDLEELALYLQKLEDLYASLSQDGKAKKTFCKWLEIHISLAESLCKKDSGAVLLWSSEAGEALSDFLSRLIENFKDFELPLHFNDYKTMLQKYLNDAVMRIKTHTHSALHILGQLEGRLIHADVMVLGGLNEGSWPGVAEADPWMSRPMRGDFGLSSPDQRIGLSAHDFVQAFCANEVLMTRAKKIDGAPAVPSRWLQRLSIISQAFGHNFEQDLKAPYLEWGENLDIWDGQIEPVQRPAPTPPVESRPKELPVTAIRSWRRDPYEVYAKYVLGLRKMDDLQKEPEFAEKGSILHKALDRFLREYKGPLDGQAFAALATIGQDLLSSFDEGSEMRTLWFCRYKRLCHWFLDHEKQWRAQFAPLHTEIKGSFSFETEKGGFNLTAKADRIDKSEDGLAIIDYKTGSVPSDKDMILGYDPQIPLEGLIAVRSGFSGLPGLPVAYLGHWRLSGGQDSGEEKTFRPGKDSSIASFLDSTEAGLKELVSCFLDEKTPYISLPNPRHAPPEDYQDYAHLSRVGEWGVQTDSTGDF